MVTIKDVAKASGYSNAMVSYALNGKGNLKEETREKILKVAQELNYIPNSAAVALRSKKTNMVGLILRDIFNPTFARLASRVEKALTEHGYRLSIFTTNGQKDINKSIMDFYGGGKLDGLIYSVIALDEESLQSLENLQNSVVISVSEMSDVEYGAYQATEHLFKQGHQIVTHIASPKEHPNSKFMIKGFERALKVYGVKVNDDLIAYGGFELEEAAKAAEKLIQTFGTPLAIFVASDYAAFGVMAFLRKKGLKVPEDVALVGWDDISFAESVGLTTVSLSQEAIAQNAVHKLLNIIEADKNLPDIIIPSYELVVRETCRLIKNY
ncbi:LacI family DNA-binding transcriptional regulator [Halalkalibacter oceani]|uniref:LacI family DNA-binding transcriptional regulator n=1 Tax=Halalkalibacter oceani TaxID=1653776 RepID=UPI0033977A0A